MDAKAPKSMPSEDTQSRKAKTVNLGSPNSTTSASFDDGTYSSNNTLAIVPIKDKKDAKSVISEDVRSRKVKAVNSGRPSSSASVSSSSGTCRSNNTFEDANVAGNSQEVSNNHNGQVSLQYINLRFQPKINRVRNNTNGDYSVQRVGEWESSDFSTKEIFDHQRLMIEKQIKLATVIGLNRASKEMSTTNGSAMG
ncbi:MAG: hypothetical protein M1821_000651 [Bathelium mastoideum]|nr:MAG: hypothetical protein M1821_000651 [Bathelium mastoideum]